MDLKCEMAVPDWWMLNGVIAAQWRKNGMMEVGEGKVVGDEKKKKKKTNNNNNNNFFMELRIMEC